MVALPKTKLAVQDYLRWSQSQPDGRFELVGGHVVMMSPETVRHVHVKNEAWLALRNAIKRAGLKCAAFGDGVGVQIDDETVREPDVSVQCKVAEDNSLLLDEPVVVLEVVSLSSVRSDTGAKVAEYFRVPSILHYLIVDPFSRSVIHHSRAGDRHSISTRIVTSGEIELSPPGFVVPVADLLGGEASDAAG
ncbi:Uma2 family endonuclease [Mesorhizobium sp. LHD-90]|uniref:Uma2 family endonuclease n=1 Tax=Mesorhizobium sp. LHD-90 TaxID=3071414 RepID=UPI0027E0A5A3|nr:Uma2 family endonuclease [Mesorhizobium sp. LHD-90]MDQ6434441.1 Uma2 family endonuclease [Mesorhizobium sp. LHD-90]